MITKHVRKATIKKNDSINQEWKNFLCSGFVGRSMISGRMDPNKTRTREIARTPENIK